jgi:hypothetical protein
MAIIIGRATMRPETRLTATPVDIEADINKPVDKTTIFKKSKL